MLSLKIWEAVFLYQWGCSLSSKSGFDGMKMWVGARELCLHDCHQEHRNVLIPRKPRQGFGQKDRGKARAEKAWRTPNFFPSFIWIFLSILSPIFLNKPHSSCVYSVSPCCSCKPSHHHPISPSNPLSLQQHHVCFDHCPTFLPKQQLCSPVLEAFKGSLWGEASWKSHRLSLQYF